MKKMNKALINSVIVLLLFIVFVSCEKDFSSLGTEVIGGENFEATSKKYSVLTYNKRVDPTRTDGLPVNYLGIFNDPIYGNTTASFVSQVATPTINPNFGENVVLDSVVLTIPYFSTVGEADVDGNPTYELDSIFGNAPMKLSGYRNNYYLRDFDPDSDFEEAQKYYSNAATSQTGMVNTAQLEGDLLFELENFLPSSDPIVLFGEPDDQGVSEETTREAPAIRVILDNEYWEDLIIDKQGEPELSNAANFENYFRGIFFKVEPVAADMGTMMLLDFAASANITMYYTKDGFSNDTDGNPIREQTTFVMNFSGNRVNFLDNNYNFTLGDVDGDGDDEGDTENGDESLYLKGGVGSIGVVNLFNGNENGESTEFTEFKEAFVETDTDGNFVKSKRLVNEANLIFYVDQSQIIGQEPDRIYLYDLNNKTPLIDYILDPSTNNFSPKDTKILHLEPLERENDEFDGAGIKYRIKITEHINNLLLRDSTNVKLGLAVSGNLNPESNTNQFDIITDDSNLLNALPISTLVYPRGTVLHGSNTTDENKKVELEIFYTFPCKGKDDDGNCCEEIDEFGNCIDN